MQLVSSVREKEDHRLLPRWVFVTAVVIFIIMTVIGLVASENPDGLEKTFEKIGVKGTESGLISFGETFASDLLTMVVGMIGAFVILMAIALVVKKLGRPT